MVHLLNKQQYNPLNTLYFYPSQPSVYGITLTNVHFSLFVILIRNIELNIVCL